MSDLDTHPDERISTCAGVDGPEELLITARRVYLGKTTEVARALPDRQIRMIGAWCFLDHYGPEDISGSAGMQVWAHPHTGLQTVTWLIEGAVEHRDSLGSQAMVRPGDLNIMTAGHGVVHSELSPPDKPAGLHGLQLWVALPEAVRDIAPAFRTHADLPTLRRPGLHGQVLLGEVDGVRSPAPTHSPLAGADLVLEPGADASIELDPDFEYGAFVVAGSLIAAGDHGVGRPAVVPGDQPPRAPTGQCGGCPAAAARRSPVHRGDRDVVELRRPQPRRDRGLPGGLGRQGREVPTCGRARGAGDGGPSPAECSAAAPPPPYGVAVNPVEALREIGFLLERSRADTFRVKAYRGAADVLTEMTEDERAAHQKEHSWGKVRGVGPKTATVITQAMSGEVPEYLQRLRDEKEPLAHSGDTMRAAVRGDLHCHSTWSDGGSPLEEMMLTARALGHEYCAITDHSPRLTVARGLSAERLREQLEVVAGLNEVMAPFRCLRGIEVDILEDGGLDQTDELLAELDVVVASVHSKLRSDSETMTHRMVGAVANPRTNVLGHCTGRLIQGERGTRPPSVFDAEVVFEACRTFDVAVEINSRPERRDPPTDLLKMAIEMGCLFSIDTDAHAPGQLEFVAYGCERAEALGLDPDRVINTWPADRLLKWCDKG